MQVTCMCIIQRTFVTRDFAPDGEGAGLPGAVKTVLTVFT